MIGRDLLPTDQIPSLSRATTLSPTHTKQRRGQISRETPQNREFIRCVLQPKMLDGLRADKNNLDSAWTLDSYEQAHQPIAAGDPPLTEMMVYRYAAFQGWLLEIPFTEPLKDKMRFLLMADWKQPKNRENDLNVLK